MLSALVFQVLLVANAGFEADIVNAWKAEATFMEVAFGLHSGSPHAGQTPRSHHGSRPPGLCEGQSISTNI